MTRATTGMVFFLVLSVLSCGHVFGEDAGAGHRFLLGPGDQLEISVWKDEALSRKIVVMPDGMITFPLIGDVMAQGLTVKELRETIQGKINEFVPDAPVNVMVLEVGSPKVYVVGKVARPGMFIMVEPLRVMQVLAMAGGMTTFAKENDIIIIRNEAQEQRVFPFQYSKVSGGASLEQNMILKPGDTVVVP